MTNETKNQRTDQRWKLARPRTEPIVEVDESWALALLDDDPKDLGHETPITSSVDPDTSICPDDAIMVSDRPSAIEAQILWRQRNVKTTSSNDEASSKLKSFFSRWS